MATQASVGIWRDRQLGAAFLAAPAFWIAWWRWKSPEFDPSWPLREPLHFFVLALAYPVLEEIVFRGGLQSFLLRYRQTAVNWCGVSTANMATSIVFAAAHLLQHSPWWATATFLPSLVFGYFRDRHNSLKSPVALHIFYNAGYYWLFGA